MAHALTLRRHGGHDRFGQRLPLGEPIALRVQSVYPRFSTGDVPTVVGLTAILEPGEPVPQDEDVLVYSGQDYEIDGEPGEWNFFDGPAGIEVALKRTES